MTPEVAHGLGGVACALGAVFGFEAGYAGWVKDVAKGRHCDLAAIGWFGVAALFFMVGK